MSVDVDRTEGSGYKSHPFENCANKVESVLAVPVISVSWQKVSPISKIDGPAMSIIFEPAISSLANDNRDRKSAEGEASISADEDFGFRKDGKS